jgi:hypothetical protein
MTSKQKFQGLVKKAIKAGDEPFIEDDETPAKVDPIGSTATSISRRNKSLRRSLINRGNSKEVAENFCLLELNSEQLLTYNPKLATFTPTTRIAYARFKNVIKKEAVLPEEEEEYAKVFRDLNFC